MSAALANCRRIQTELNTAVLLVHHSGKNGGSERGSSALRGAADVALKVDDADGTLIIINDKAKDSEKLPRRRVKLHQTEAREGRTSCVPISVDKGQTDSSGKLTPSQVQILEILALDAFTTDGVLSATIQAETGISSVHRILRDLTDRGYISQSKQREPFIITAEGRTALAQHERLNSHH